MIEIVPSHWSASAGCSTSTCHRADVEGSCHELWSSQRASEKLLPATLSGATRAPSLSTLSKASSPEMRSTGCT